MADIPSGRGFLAAYRVLDLTDQRGLLAGHMLAQLGADVLQIEPPAGSPARRAAPLDTRDAAAQSSFYWAAYASGKRSVVCDLDQPEGRRQFLKLVEHADILFESDTPGALAARGLGWEQLREVNPRLIYVSITPFGSDGPKAGYADSEIIVWASGGPLFPCRDNEGPPLRVSVPQAYLHAASDAACGALVALFARMSTGCGQHVDVSAQQSVGQATLSSVLAAAVNHHDYPNKRAPGAEKPATEQAAVAKAAAPKPPIPLPRTKWPVRDGLLELRMGTSVAAAGSGNRLFAWMKERGELPEKYADFNWLDVMQRVMRGELDNEVLVQARLDAGQFLSQFTMAELFEVALKTGIQMAPVLTTRDLLDSPQLVAREFIQTVTDDFGPLRIPGNFARVMVEDPDAAGQLVRHANAFVPLTRAPRLGEHTAAAMRDWLDVPSGQAATGTAGQRENRKENRKARPFEGLKVLDFSWVVAGPMVGRVLAEYGATVIRVESSTRVESARGAGPYRDGIQDVRASVLFENCNVNKLGVSLLLKSPEAQAVARDLAQWADVVVESFTPGQMDRWGLGYDVLSKLNPRLIMVSSALMGRGGPYSDFSGFGNVGAAVSGFQAIVGREGELPVGPWGPYTDYPAPRFTLVTLLGALDERRRTGKGCWIDISQTETGMQWLAPQFAESSVTGVGATALGNRDPSFAPHGVFACAGDDRWVALCARDDDDWRRLAAAMGQDGLAQNTRFATLAARKANEDDLDAIVSQWTARHSPSEAEVLLQSHGVPAHVVNSSADFMADPQLIARGHFVRLPHPWFGEAVVEMSRVRLSDTPAVYERCAPPVGRDNATVLQGFLGYDDARVAALAAAGALT